MIDVNMYQESIFHTKMILREFDLDNYLFDTPKDSFTPAERKKIKKENPERNDRNILWPQHYICEMKIRRFGGFYHYSLFAFFRSGTSPSTTTGSG